MSHGRKALIIYLMAGPETPALAEAAVEGGADVLEIGFPVLGPARRRPGDPPGRRARPRRGHAHERVPRVSGRDAAARGRPPRADDLRLAPRGLRLRALRGRCARRRRDGLIVADLPVDEHPRAAPHPARRPDHADRADPARRRAHGRLALPRLAHRHDRRARVAVSSQLPDLVARARAVTAVPLYAGFGIATPEQAAEAGDSRRRHRRRQPRDRGRVDESGPAGSASSSPRCARRSTPCRRPRSSRELSTGPAAGAPRTGRSPRAWPPEAEQRRGPAARPAGLATALAGRLEQSRAGRARAGGSSPRPRGRARPDVEVAQLRDRERGRRQREADVRVGELRAQPVAAGEHDRRGGRRRVGGSGVDRGASAVSGGNAGSTSLGTRPEVGGGELPLTRMTVRARRASRAARGATAPVRPP